MRLITSLQNGAASLSGIIIEADPETGLAKRVKRLIEGGSLIK